MHHVAHTGDGGTLCGPHQRNTKPHDLARSRNGLKGWMAIWDRILGAGGLCQANCIRKILRTWGLDVVCVFHWGGVALIGGAGNPRAAHKCGEGAQVLRVKGYATEGRITLRALTLPFRHPGLRPSIRPPIDTQSHPRKASPDRAPKSGDGTEVMSL